MRTGRPAYLRTFDYLGLHRYFLTFCTDRRRRLFVREETVELVLQQILRASRERAFAVVAYCFMPDHLHLLVEAQSRGSDARRFIRDIKQYSGYQYARQFHEKLWQRYGFEHVLRDEETTQVVAAYVVGNPVRAGLVRRVLDYPFVGSFVYDLSDLL